MPPTMNEVANGYTNQSAFKNWILLYFAKRVADGCAKPHETEFMKAFMDADIPAKELIDDARDVANTVGMLIGLENMDFNQSFECFQKVQQTQSNKNQGGE